MEDRNGMLNETVMRLREPIHDLDSRRGNAEHEVSHATKEAADAQKKLTIAEGALELSNRVRLIIVALWYFSFKLAIFSNLTILQHVI